MKRRQKRYTTEEQITSEIDAKKAEAKECLEEAVRCDAVVELCYKEMALIEPRLETAKDRALKKLQEELHALEHKADLHKKRAVANSKRRNRIENTTLPKLKDALAEFRTALMSYTQDPGVVLK